MQVIELPAPLVVLVYAGLWFLFQMGAALLCYHIPDGWYAQDHALFATYPWEREGDFYQQVFRVKAWKHLLPDGGALFRRGYRKKHLRSFSPENLRQYLIESRRAELTHWVAILPFWVFGFIGPPQVIWMMLLYALAVNLPCLIAQRYNRPRIAALLARVEQREAAPARAS